MQTRAMYEYLFCEIEQKRKRVICKEKKEKRKEQELLVFYHPISLLLPVYSLHHVLKKNILTNTENKKNEINTF
jgi:hypothetical protein